MFAAPRFAARYVSRSRKSQDKSQVSYIRDADAEVGSGISDDSAIMNRGKAGVLTGVELRDNKAILDDVTRPTCLHQHSASSAEDNQRATCWSCDIPICDTCTFQGRASSHNIQHHIDNCTPYCHRCYYREVCRHQRSLRHPQRCSHSSDTLNSGLTQAPQTLCEQCSLMDAKDIGKRRDERERKTLALLAGQAIRCANCQGELPVNGPRWWVCDICRLECVDSCHYRGATAGSSW